ncbi:Fe(3+) ABC transporter substrate-binding protein [Geoalkalibacter halelectricus]|uniref:Fe(3+) ABC transporter substrate-binding protein n=1 Tax=Geoalkalibacter halelectricus TaxID=2847045 RepID=A0ABY5ZIT4_9BACT|nr:Fe(3+) ABC transporter substrate-binding protein [Geoalkalibacter halelectricus]MDO3378941.1 Fe(3+) ABC transporter substrate-binding protein [Geoalkalibacter halelectricus]UWZ79036.1 Fe(3+) ABC transporter substrate-binding protein [Geoalkalibacter halelectricus]
MSKLRIALLAVLVVLVGLPVAAVAQAQEVVVYSARNEHLIRPVFEAYTRETGVQVTFVTDREGPLLQRLKSEGRNTRADLLLTVDAGNLWHAAQEGLLQPVDSAVLAANIPEHLRDPDNQWFGLSLRARTIVYSPERVNPEELSTYAALGEPQWKGRLLLRTSQKVYNQSLVAMLIAERGVEEAEKIVRSWVDNLAAPPFANDNAVMEAIAAGQGDVGIVNTYYLGRLLRDNPDLPVALFWADQEESGVHVNVSGAGVTRHARNPEGAIKLLEWMSSEAAQNLFVDANREYPVNPVVTPHPDVAAWGPFKQNPINVARAGELQTQAIMLMDRAGYR